MRAMVCSVVAAVALTGGSAAAQVDSRPRFHIERVSPDRGVIVPQREPSVRLAPRGRVIEPVPQGPQIAQPAPTPPQKSEPRGYYIPGAGRGGQPPPPGTPAPGDAGPYGGAAGDPAGELSYRHRQEIKQMCEMAGTFRAAFDVCRVAGSW